MFNLLNLLKAQSVKHENEAVLVAAPFPQGACGVGQVDDSARVESPNWTISSVFSRRRFSFGWYVSTLTRGRGQASDVAQVCTLPGFSDLSFMKAALKLMSEEEPFPK